MEKKVNYTGQLSFIDLLTLAFIVLKLTGFIDWSWIWVLSPMWILLIIAIIVIAFTMLGKNTNKR